MAIPVLPSPAPPPLPPQENSKKRKSASGFVAVAKRLSIFAVAGFTGGFLCFAADLGQVKFEDYLRAQISRPIDDIVIVEPKTKEKQSLKLDAKAAAILQIGAAGREKIIFKENIDQVLPIASLTKLMTAAIVLENPQIYNLERRVAIGRNAANQENVPVFGNLMPGEIYSIKDLLGIMLFYSSNDAACALAEIAGMDSFVAAMNKKASLIGLERTKFYNATGLDIENGLENQSTADDLLILVCHILKFHPDIFALTATSGPYSIENGIFDLIPWDNQKLIGGKTGYTERAGGCMISVFENEGGRRYVNVLLGSLSAETRVAQMQKMINFSNNYR